MKRETMLHQAVGLVIFAALVGGAAEAPWKSAGACLTPQGTLCTTLKWKSTGWENASWGFYAIRRWSGSAVLAYSQNGPIMERYTQQNYRNWLSHSLRYSICFACSLFHGCFAYIVDDYVLNSHIFPPQLEAVRS